MKPLQDLLAGLAQALFNICYLGFAALLILLGWIFYAGIVDSEREIGAGGEVVKQPGALIIVAIGIAMIVGFRLRRRIYDWI